MKIKKHNKIIKCDFITQINLFNNREWCRVYITGSQTNPTNYKDNFLNKNIN